VHSSILTAEGGRFSEMKQTEMCTSVPVKDDDTNTLEEGLLKYIEAEQVDY
jgi:hypothetical protein